MKTTKLERQLIYACIGLILSVVAIANCKAQTVLDKIKLQPYEKAYTMFVWDAYKDANKEQWIHISEYIENDKTRKTETYYDFYTWIRNEEINLECLMRPYKIAIVYLSDSLCADTTRISVYPSEIKKVYDDRTIYLDGKHYVFGTPYDDPFEKFMTEEHLKLRQQTQP